MSLSLKNILSLSAMLNFDTILLKS